jgi:hypothetical protein
MQCPTCGYEIDPPPQRSKKCPACHNLIVRRLKYTTGVAVYLKERQVPSFDRQQKKAKFTSLKRHRIQTLKSQKRMGFTHVQILQDAMSESACATCKALFGKKIPINEALAGSPIPNGCEREFCCQCQYTPVVSSYNVNADKNLEDYIRLMRN